MPPSRAEIGDEHPRLDAEPGEELPVFRFDGAVDRLVVLDGVHLIDQHGDLPQPQQAEQVAVPAALLAYPFVGGDEQQGGVGAGRAGDHVLEELLVAGGVDEHRVAPARGAEGDLGNVDGDVLVALGLEGVHEEGVLERHAAPAAGSLDTLQLALRERAAVVQQAADERGLAVVYVADDDDAQGLGGGIHGTSIHIYPLARSRSNASSLSWSCARVLRSATVVPRNSAMISGTVAAWDSTVPVHGAQPRLR